MYFSALRRVYREHTVVVLHRNDQHVVGADQDVHGLRFEPVPGAESDNCLYQVEKYLKSAYLSKEPRELVVILTWHGNLKGSKDMSGEKVLHWKEWEKEFISGSDNAGLGVALRKAGLELLAADARQVLYQELREAVDGHRTVVQVVSRAIEKTHGRLSESVVLEDSHWSWDRVYSLVYCLMMEVPVLLDESGGSIVPGWADSDKAICKVEEGFEEKMDSGLLRQLIRLRGELPLAATREVAQVIYGEDGEVQEQKIADLGRFLVKAELAIESAGGVLSIAS